MTVLPRFRTLRARIIVLFAVLVVAGQAIGYLLMDGAHRSTAQQQLERSLAAGERVFGRQLQHSRAQLAQAAGVLAADFALREAIATRDAATLASVLANHGRRIAASTMMLLSLDGQVLADARDDQPGAGRRAASRVPYPGLFERASRGEGASGVVIDEGRPYQVVIVPVLAPVPIAWIAVGFLIDDDLANDLKALTGLEVSFVARQRDTFVVLASTMASGLDATLTGRLLAAGHDIGEPATGADAVAQVVEVGEDRYGTRILALEGERTGQVSAVLQQSIDELLRGYDRLRQFLAVLAVASVCVLVVLGYLVARSITRPLAMLGAGAARMRRGDYSEPIVVRQRDEVGMLADSFNRMREDIASREREILRLAYVDRLTGLSNRAGFNERLERAIASHRSIGQRFAVVLMNLDRFRLVNDTLGHEAGDDVLRQVGDRLVALIGDPQHVAHFGGDEFAVLLDRADSGSATRVAERILECLKAPFGAAGQPVHVGASLGLAVFPDHAEDAGALARHADMAMFAAKRTHVGYAVFDPSHDVARQEHLSLLGELRRAVEERQLRVHYQPKIDLAQGCTYGVEALVRWEHPDRGLVPPSAFVPFAEQTGFIRTVTRWVLDEAIRQCGEWHRNASPLNVAVNLSTRDLHDPGLVGLVSDMLARHRVPAPLVTLEITESSFIDDPELALRTLRSLRALGLGLSIDDFGTGFSSLGYLKRLPVGELKIDRTFVSGMLGDRDDLVIVQSTVELAHNLGLRVVAEGVEDEAVVEALRRIGCDAAQGWFASPARAPDALGAWLAESPWGIRPSRDEVVRGAFLM